MSNETKPDGPSTDAEALFAAWASRAESGELTDFEELVRASPGAAVALRALHDDWKLFAPILGKVVPGLIASDSGVVMPSLTGGPDADEAEAPSSELLARLGIHTPNEGRYRFRAVLGRGGGGVVLKVWDTKLNRPLAMKVVLGRGEEPRSGQTPKVDGRMLSRFVDEARIASQLNHPGIVPVHELGADETGRAYFTMKLVKGDELSRIFEYARAETNGWSMLRALTVLLRVCDAMSYAHDRGVIHRDLKPANVMVGSYGEVHVMDWGLARVIGAPASEEQARPKPPASVVDSVREAVRSETPGSPLLTGVGNTFGTPSYMSPEQAKGEVETLGTQTDVYAIGAMLYELLGGEAPYSPRGARVDWQMIVMAVMHGPPKSLEALSPRAPAELVAICERAMARELGERYATMRALEQDLRAFVEGRVVSAFETGTWAETKKWVQRNRALAGSLGAVVLAVTLGAGLFAYKAKEANLNLALAQAEAQRADEIAQKANRLADDVLARERELRIRGLIPELQAFDESDDSMAHALSDNRPANEWWLERAHLLHDGQREDGVRGVRWSPGLADVRAHLATMRENAEPWTSEEQAKDLREHPGFQKLEILIARRIWYQRMLGEVPWPSDSDANLEGEELWGDAPIGKLIARAWSSVRPKSEVRGDEVLALALARRALASATGAARVNAREAMAWALYRCGRLDEALVEMLHAVDDAPEGQKIVIFASQEELQEHVAQWRGTSSRLKRAHELDGLQLQIAQLKDAYSERRTWRFAGYGDLWLYEQLVELERNLVQLQARIEIAEMSVRGVETERAWSEAIESIAKSEKYRGVRWPRGDRLTPQVGLVPIGADPASGLWEFAHLATGDRAERDSSGKIVLKSNTGLVFVLLPGGRVFFETSVYRHQVSSSAQVDLAPFFLSKYEMTDGQWDRLEGRPARLNDESALLPTVGYTPEECAVLLRRAGWMDIPFEAQWEYGCRAGTTTLWWPGNDERDLLGAANVGQKNPRKRVGSMNANGFGVHDVHGNVSEWCRSGANSRLTVSSSPRDGALQTFAAEYVLRGGSYFEDPASAASSQRNSSPARRSDAYGVRPARLITP